MTSQAPLDEILGAILDGIAPLDAGSAIEFFRGHRARAGDAQPAVAAALGGARADRMGYAFVAGYSAALSALVPGRNPDRPAALCVTEAGGTHPRAIETRLEAGALVGHKTFVTMGSDAEELFVLASEGTTPEGRRRLRLVTVDARATGVSMEPAREMPFVPEVPHAAVRFEGAEVSGVLEGEGWNAYVRPFRTIEDIHVHLALAGWLLATGLRLDFPRASLEEGCAILAALLELAVSDAGSRSTHLALAGAIASTGRWIHGLEAAWEGAPREDRERFERDRPLLRVAEKARRARTAAAWG